MSFALAGGFFTTEPPGGLALTLNQLWGGDPTQLSGVNTRAQKQGGGQFLPLLGRLGKACFRRPSAVLQAREVVWTSAGAAAHSGLLFL